ncbi:hypothetical protein KPL78_18610 [Roseomonas sp. HJA6]|uniref:Uncharacterized protein n=1 Tax=Roseomonas alba TaxID=2846776 RepID=A0ABS7ACI3_9PROT|nr:hypothetical protein [Neoroseomonas alba]MBW6399878.1 hypothetical protein [Neoroseomonas alba]
MSRAGAGRFKRPLHHEALSHGGSICYRSALMLTDATAASRIARRMFGAIGALDMHIEADSDAAVALAPLRMVMSAEGQDEDGVSGEWVLATDARCLRTVPGEEPVAAEGDQDQADTHP